MTLPQIYEIVGTDNCKNTIKGDQSSIPTKNSILVTLCVGHVIINCYKDSSKCIKDYFYKENGYIQRN